MEKSRKALERAFELAKSGACTSVDDLKRCLVLEGFHISQIVRSRLARQLRTLIAEAREEATTFVDDGKVKLADPAAQREAIARTGGFSKKRSSEVAEKAALKRHGKTT